MEDGDTTSLEDRKIGASRDASSCGANTLCAVRYAQGYPVMQAPAEQVHFVQQGFGRI